MPSPPGQLLSTGQAARLLSVTPDTVLKWIRHGRIPAIRTAGGHHRIDASDLAALVEARRRKPSHLPPQSRPLRCWEYLHGHAVVRSECKECAVYRFRAARCFEVRQSVFCDQAGGFCATACHACPYYLRAHGEPQRVLVISTDRALSSHLAAASGSVFDFRTAASAYEAGVTVAEFFPALVLVDEQFDPAGQPSLVAGLLEDPRIPWVRVVLLYRHKPPGKLPAGVYAALPASFQAPDLAPLARLEPVEASAD